MTDYKPIYRYRIRGWKEHFGPLCTSYGEAFEEAVGFFRQNLADLPPKRLPRATIEVKRRDFWAVEALIAVPAIIQALRSDEPVHCDPYQAPN